MADAVRTHVLSDCGWHRCLGACGNAVLAKYRDVLSDGIALRILLVPTADFETTTNPTIRPSCRGCVLGSPGRPLPTWLFEQALVITRSSCPRHKGWDVSKHIPDVAFCANMWIVASMAEVTPPCRLQSYSTVFDVLLCANTGGISGGQTDALCGLALSAANVCRRVGLSWQHRAVSRESGFACSALQGRVRQLLRRHPSPFADCRLDQSSVGLAKSCRVTTALSCQHRAAS